MKVSLGSDHAGFELKKILMDYLKQGGHELIDVGTNGTQPVDYPDFAEALALSLLRGAAERGILICGSGVGASVAANKVPGIRAAICHDVYSAHQGVEHDDMNILCLGSEVIGAELAVDLVRAFLAARFDGGERYVRRLKKVEEMERAHV